jgi:CRISPR-associated protein Csx14
MRNVLVAVLGITPAILTEAIYYYERIAKPKVRFFEIDVYTTTVGRDLAYKKLLGVGGGTPHYFELLDFLGLRRTQIDFSESHIHVLKGPDGQELEDVRTREDSLAIADQLCAAIQKLRANPENRIFATMAGGRKTMGLYMALAVQLLARPGDRLFHVLPDARIERSNTECYYPFERVTINGETIEPEDIRIECDEVPLIYWPWEAGKRPGAFRFSELQEQRQRELMWLYEPPVININLASRQIAFGDQSVDLTPSEFFYYYFFAQRTLALGPDSAAIPLTALSELWEKVRNKYPRNTAGPVLHQFIELKGQSLYGVLSDLESNFYWLLPQDRGREVGFARRMDTDLRNPDSKAVVPLSTNLSKLAKKLKGALGQAMGEEYSIRNRGARGTPRYGIWVNQERIRISNPKSANRT